MIKYLKTEDEIWDSVRKGEYVRYARLIPRAGYASGVFKVEDLSVLRDNLKHLDTTIFFVEVEE